MKGYVEYIRLWRQGRLDKSYRWLGATYFPAFLPLPLVFIDGKMPLIHSAFIVIVIWALVVVIGNGIASETVRITVMTEETKKEAEIFRKLLSAQLSDMLNPREHQSLSKYLTRPVETDTQITLFEKGKAP